MNRYPIFSPYPKVELGADEIQMVASALRDMLSEITWTVCTETGCGCPSSQKAKFAKDQLDKLESIVNRIGEQQDRERSGVAGRPAQENLDIAPLRCDNPSQ